MHKLGTIEIAAGTKAKAFGEWGKHVDVVLREGTCSFYGVPRSLNGDPLNIVVDDLSLIAVSESGSPVSLSTRAFGLLPLLYENKGNAILDPAYEVRRVERDCWGEVGYYMVAKTISDQMFGCLING